MECAPPLVVNQAAGVTGAATVGDFGGREASDRIVCERERERERESRSLFVLVL